MNKFWFYLKSSVYVESKPQHILLYDTDSGNYWESVSVDVISLIKELYKDVNLGVISIDKAMLSPDASEGIDCIIERKMGFLYEIKSGKMKPISLIPLLTLKKDMEKLLSNEEALSYLQRDLGKYVLEVNIHLNDVCNLSCKWCNKYNKQFLSCSKEHVGNLSPLLLERIFKQIQFLPIPSVNIVGGDCFKYRLFDLLEEFKGKYNKDVNIYSHYKNIPVNIFKTTYIIHAIIPFPIDINAFQCVFNHIRSVDKLHFIIEDELQYDQLQMIVDEFSIKEESIEIHPFYNGNNIDFFEKCVYLDKEDILSKKISMREILRNKKLNVHTFGGLHIFPNGDVKGSILTDIIGNIQNENIVNIIFKELKSNTAWRLVRDMAPCSDCVLQWFCPPPSNYEHVMKKPNLCHVKF